MTLRSLLSWVVLGLLPAMAPLPAATALAAGGAQRAAKGPLVVIDPGHGGTNVGAFGPATKTFEKKLTLSIARRAAKLLRASAGGRLRVVLTRRRDRYLTLQQRVRIANQLGAAAFISVHLNASEARAYRGFETYILSRSAADAEAKRIALSVGRPSRHPVGRRETSRGDLAAILTDLSQRAQLEGSTRLALAIHRSLRACRGKARDRGMRQAPFDVLMGLRMPGVLVEVGFIDHPVEGPELAREATQRRLAAALAAGIRSFVLASR